MVTRTDWFKGQGLRRGAEGRAGAERRPVAIGEPSRLALAPTKTMPIYEYACPSCAVTFEALIIRRSDEAEVECPTCHSSEVRRQLSTTAAIRSGGAGGGGKGAGRSCGPIG